jgi:hypothetical protein
LAIFTHIWAKARDTHFPHPDYSAGRMRFTSGKRILNIHKPITIKGNPPSNGIKGKLEELA